MTGPYFPFGVWDPAGDYRGVAEYGMNCFLAHASPDDMGQNRGILDAAQAHGLKVNLYLVTTTSSTRRPRSESCGRSKIIQPRSRG